MPRQNGKQKTAQTPAVKHKKLRSSVQQQGITKQGERTDKIYVDVRRNDNPFWAVEQVKRTFQHKRTTPMPRQLKPMLASVVDEPFDDKEWQFEIKWDGYRCLAYIGNGKANLFSRNNLSFNRKYPSIVEALKTWPFRAVVDGEIVIMSEDGKADFAALQAWDGQPRGELLFFLFDLLWIEGIDLQKEPLSLRREVLRRVMPESGPIRFSDCIETYGVDFFKAAKDNGLEGIVAKRKSSLYKPAQRTAEWVKIKAEERHEAIICGYTRNRGSDRLFSSLILAIPKEEKLEFIGQVGTGFSNRLQATVMNKLMSLRSDASPFETTPAIDGFVQWVSPRLVCEVKYTERTKDGLMRHPSFKGLREDKSAGEINVTDSKKQLEARPKGTQPAAKGPLVSKEKSAVVTVENQELKLTNLTKLYWPKEKITKGDLLNYYDAITPYILPYMEGRPQSLNRFPSGINGESFYQKNMKGKVEPWLQTFERFSDSGDEAKDFLVCTGAASLLYMANLGCIEMNPWHSRVHAPHNPDWCVIDLDPGKIAFTKIIETANVVHGLLESLQVPSYPKTSGSTGIHIYIPLGGKYNYEQSRQLAEIIATLVHHELPSFTSLERNPRKRTDKIYLDYLQNRPIQTICAPYSLRPKPGATASAPLHWSEVKKGLQIKQFTIKNMLARVNREGDLFGGVLGKGIELNDVLKRLSGML